ncbi:histidine--tRNA ligase [Buchnera aphidicola]|uniref:Histidine--tRNA ligase n=1 Tax=Buchnera aphidicola subsp. Melaphis rhois TaxID=118103 RepID=A0A4D6YAE8_BUCMH|nr:histidine--tRNA ligase [Buchnera aphidicola]QCI23291.1 histidine--tRNA ligase [Buchnera aphidicola (Melaphis rhois)]
MANIIQSVKGMHDYIPKDIQIWQYIEKIFKNVLNSYSYQEIRFPIIEKTELFQRGIGNTTDIIEKEMYSFKDKKNSNLTLRPEGTVGCMRSCIKNGLLRHSEQRLWYLGPMFRYEKPQCGRYRQFHQLGIESFGLIGPDIDLEVIMLVQRIWKYLHISQYINLELNTIGSIHDRINYKKSLYLYFKKYESLLDKDCQRRLYTNPFRILDSKNDSIKEIIDDAPILTDYIDDDSSIHFEQLCKLMDKIGISYIVNYKLVRGLDYYNKTVFEWTTNKLASKHTICAGGRYDYLSKYLGSISVPAIGCAIGVERLILLLKSLKNQSLNVILCIDIFIIFLQKEIELHAIKLSENVRTAFPDKNVQINFLNSNITKQFRKANRLGARIVLLLGLIEVKNKTVLIKDLKFKKQKISLIKNVIQELKLFFVEDNL